MQVIRLHRRRRQSSKVPLTGMSNAVRMYMPCFTVSQQRARFLIPQTNPDKTTEPLG